MGLLPGRLRWPVAWLVVFSAVGIGGLGWRYAGGNSAGRVDGAIDEGLIRAGTGHLRVLQLVAALGGPTALVLSSCMMLLAVWRARSQTWRAELIVASAPALASLLTEAVLKPFIGRTHGGGLAFPSGHATGISALATVVVLLCTARGVPRRRGFQRAVFGVAGFLVIVVSAAQVSLDRHYASDTVAGVLTGICVVGLLVLVLDHRIRRRSRVE